MHFEKGLLVISKMRLVAGAAVLASPLKRLLQLCWSTVIELCYGFRISTVFSRSKGGIEAEERNSINSKRKISE